MRIVFHRVEEFLDEIDKTNRVDDGIVRVCCLMESGGDPTLVRAYIVAGAIVRGKLIELKAPIGQLMNGEQMPPEAIDQIERMIEKKARERSLEIRAGRFMP